MAEERVSLSVGVRGSLAEVLVPGCLLGLALVVRLWGIKQGYPDLYGHVDEIGVAASIWNFFRNHTLLPTEFTYPPFFCTSEFARHRHYEHG